MKKNFRIYKNETVYFYDLLFTNKRFFRTNELNRKNNNSIFNHELFEFQFRFNFIDFTNAIKQYF